MNISRYAASGVVLVALCATAGIPALAQQPERPSGWTDATHSNEAAPAYERLFATDRVHELRIRIGAADFQLMQDDLATISPLGGMLAGRGMPPPGGFRPMLQGGGGFNPDMLARDPIYVPVTVSFEGSSWTGVGMRYKGNSSLVSASTSGNGKVPFRLDFDRYEDELPATRNQRFFGFEKLTFSSNYTDNTLLKEVLATEAFRDGGVPAARAAFYRVFVDTGNGDEYWGLYTMIEDPADGAMLDAQFGDGSGNLYKPSGDGANWVRFDEDGFPKKTNEEAADYSDIAAAIVALHAARGDPAAWRAELEARFDVEVFLRWLAVNTVMDNWDSYGRLAHNYYVYGDPAEDGQLHWIPWDHNMSFGMAGGSAMGLGRIGGAVPDAIRNAIGERLGGANPLAAMFGGGSNDLMHRNAGTDWPLISRLLADSSYAARYQVLLGEAVAGYLEPSRFAARARELHALIAPFVIGESGERSSHTTLSAPNDFGPALEELIAHIRARAEFVRRELELLVR